MKFNFASRGKSLCFIIYMWSYKHEHKLSKNIKLRGVAMFVDYGSNF